MTPRGFSSKDQEPEDPTSAFNRMGIAGRTLVALMPPLSMLGALMLTTSGNTFSTLNWPLTIGAGGAFLGWLIGGIWNAGRPFEKFIKTAATCSVVCAAFGLAAGVRLNDLAQDEKEKSQLEARSNTAQYANVPVISGDTLVPQAPVEAKQLCHGPAANLKRFEDGKLYRLVQDAQNNTVRVACT